MSMKCDGRKKKHKKKCSVKHDQRLDTSITALVAASVMNNPPQPVYQDRSNLPERGLAGLVQISELQTEIGDALDNMGLQNLKNVSLKELEPLLIDAVKNKILDIRKDKSDDPSEGSAQQGGKPPEAKNTNDGKKEENNKTSS